MEEEEERGQRSWRASRLFMPDICLRRLAGLGSPLITEAHSSPYCLSMVFELSN
jgi:hypothetical protein